MPRSAASSSVPGLVTVTHMGGCGFCTGLGRTLRSGIEKQRPSYAKGSSAHMRGSTRTNSSQVFLVSSGLAPKPLSSGQAQTYHKLEFTAETANYYKQDGAVQGQWQGQLSEKMGLRGAVTRKSSLV